MTIIVNLSRSNPVDQKQALTDLAAYAAHVPMDNYGKLGSIS